MRKPLINKMLRKREKLCIKHGLSTKLKKVTTKRVIDWENLENRLGVLLTFTKEIKVQDYLRPYFYKKRKVTKRYFGATGEQLTKSKARYVKKLRQQNLLAK